MEKIEQYNVSIKQIDYNSPEEWSKIIQRLASVGMWPEGEDGVKLALNLVGIKTEELE